MPNKLFLFILLVVVLFKCHLNKLKQKNESYTREYNKVQSFKERDESLFRQSGFLRSNQKSEFLSNYIPQVQEGSDYKRSEFKQIENY